MKNPTQNQCIPIYSRRHQHYHSQRSTRTVDLNHSHQRPTSTYYEYETFQYNGGMGTYNPNTTTSPPHFNHHIALNGSQRKIHNGQTPLKYRSPNGHNSSIRSRGPFVTQVTIREHSQPPTNSHKSSTPSSNGVTSTSKIWQWRPQPSPAQLPLLTPSPFNPLITMNLNIQASVV